MFENSQILDVKHERSQKTFKIFEVSSSKEKAKLLLTNEQMNPDWHHNSELIGEHLEIKKIMI
jgi:hypothetical protein